MVAFWTGELEVPIVRSVELLDDVAFGSKADIGLAPFDVRFTQQTLRMSVECAFARTRMAAVATSKSRVRAKLSRLVLPTTSMADASRRAGLYVPSSVDLAPSNLSSRLSNST